MSRQFEGNAAVPCPVCQKPFVAVIGGKLSDHYDESTWPPGICAGSGREVERKEWEDED